MGSRIWKDVFVFCRMDIYTYIYMIAIMKVGYLGCLSYIWPTLSYIFSYLIYGYWQCAGHSFPNGRHKLIGNIPLNIRLRKQGCCSPDISNVQRSTHRKCNSHRTNRSMTSRWVDLLRMVKNVFLLPIIDGLKRRLKYSINGCLKHHLKAFWPSTLLFMNHLGSPCSYILCSCFPECQK